MVTLRGLGYLGWQFLFSYIFSGVTISLARFLAYLRGKADVPCTLFSCLYTGSCRSPEGFINPEGSVKVKMFLHDGVLGKILEIPNQGVPAVLRCLTTSQALLSRMNMRSGKVVSCPGRQKQSALHLLQKKNERVSSD